MNASYEKLPNDLQDAEDFETTSELYRDLQTVLVRLPNFNLVMPSHKRARTYIRSDDPF